MIRHSGEKITVIFQHQGKVRLRMGWLLLKGGEKIGVAGSKLGLVASPQIDREGNEVRIM